MQIPISDLPEPLPYSKTINGHVFAYEYTIPVIVTTNPAGTTIDKNPDADNLGEWLKGISEALSEGQVADLLKGRTVRL